MNALVVTFALENLDDAAYRQMAESIAPAWNDVPGLITKIWVANEASNTYGGIYLFETESAIEAYLCSELGVTLQANPRLRDIEISTFAVLSALTGVTQGSLAIMDQPALV